MRTKTVKAVYNRETLKSETANVLETQSPFLIETLLRSEPTMYDVTTSTDFCYPVALPLLFQTVHVVNAAPEMSQEVCS